MFDIYFNNFEIGKFSTEGEMATASEIKILSRSKEFQVPVLGKTFRINRLPKEIFDTLSVKKAIKSSSTIDNTPLKKVPSLELPFDLQSATLQEEDEPIVKEKISIRQYSTGLTFRTKVHVKKIPCDQLPPLKTQKSRRTSNRERRYWVVRKLHKIGGWIRFNRSKKKENRVYVFPNTILPKMFQKREKSKRAKREQIDWKFFDV